MAEHIERPAVTPKGHSVLQLLDLHPEWTVTQAIEHIERIQADVDSAFEEKP